MIVPEKEPRATRLVNYAILALIFIGALVVTLSNGGGDFSHFAFGEGGIVLTDSKGTPTVVRYEEMNTVELIESPDYGAPAGGDTVNGVREGVWESAMFGRYVASAEERIPICIFVQTDGASYIFNCEAASTTRELYDTILRRIAGEE